LDVRYLSSVPKGEDVKIKFTLRLETVAFSIVVEGATKAIDKVEELLGHTAVVINDLDGKVVDQVDLRSEAER
jgi:hypothetical protein